MTVPALSAPDDDLDDPPRITYRFNLAGGVKEIVLDFDSDSFELRSPREQTPASWTRLDFHQCPHCPLSADAVPLCPFAYGFSGVVADFDAFYSYEVVLIEVETAHRTISARVPLQSGVASLVGLIGATSGCPHLAFFRPLARFHLPFAGDRETHFRVFSMYLLGRFLNDGKIAGPVNPLDRLKSLGEAVVQVNEAMAERVRDAFDKDVVVNAIVSLDCLAQAVPTLIDEGLAELRKLFD